MRRARYFWPPDPRWRERAAIAGGLNVVAGIWLIASPWVLGFADADPVWSAVLVGAAVAALACLRLVAALRISELGWMNALLGVWTAAAAFWLYDTSDGAWNSFVVGLVVFVLGLASAAASESRPGNFTRTGQANEARHVHH